MRWNVGENCPRQLLLRFVTILKRKHIVKINSIEAGAGKSRWGSWELLNQNVARWAHTGNMQGIVRFKYKTSYQICKQLPNKAFDIQDSSGKVRCTSIQHLQLLYPTNLVLTQLPDMTSFGCMTKYINHPRLMPNLHAMESNDKTKQRCHGN